MVSIELKGDKMVSFPELAEVAGRVLQQYGLELRQSSHNSGQVMVGAEQIGYLTFYETPYYPEADRRAKLQVYSGVPNSRKYDWTRISEEITQEWPKTQS